MGVDQLARVVVRHRLDPDRAGQRDQREIEAVTAQQAAALVR
jgi:hypothetical protein